MGSSTEGYQATLKRITWPDLIPNKGEATFSIPFEYGGIDSFQNNSYVAYSSYTEENYQYYVNILDSTTYNYFAFMLPSTVNTVYQLYMLSNQTLILPVINIDVKTNSISEMTIVSRDLSGYDEEGDFVFFFDFIK